MQINLRLFLCFFLHGYSLLKALRMQSGGLSPALHINAMGMDLLLLIGVNTENCQEKNGKNAPRARLSKNIFAKTLDKSPPRCYTVRKPGKTGGAEKLFEKCLRISPNNKDAKKEFYGRLSPGDSVFIFNKEEKTAEKAEKAAE